MMNYQKIINKNVGGELIDSSLAAANAC